MKYVYYLQNGTAVDSLPEGYKGFYVAEDIGSDTEISRYFYPGDKVQYDLDALCVDIYDVFQDAIFPSRDDFYKNYGIQPQWISRAGLDSDFDIPVGGFKVCEAPAVCGIGTLAVCLIGNLGHAAPSFFPSPVTEESLIF